EPLDGDGGQAHRERVRVGQVDPVVGVVEPAGHGGGGGGGGGGGAGAGGGRGGGRGGGGGGSRPGGGARRADGGGGGPGGGGVVGRMGGGERGVEAEGGLVAVVLDARRGRVAVRAHVGQGHEVGQQPLGDGIEARGRDDVAREGQAGARVLDGGGHGGEVAAA